jgi:hypothetical protein
MRLRGSFGIALASVAAVGCGHEVPSPQAAEAPLLVTDVRLTPSVDAAARRFGRAMAASDDGAIVVIGAPDDSVLDPQGGAAHVFTRSVGGGYTEAAVLRPSVHGSLDQFGAHVAISADGARIAVGAPGAGVADTGAVFVFSSVAGVWTEEAALSPMGAQNADEVSPVALDGTGTTLLVGSPNDSTTTCTGCGAAFVFVRSGSAWTEEAALLSPAPAPFEKMGWAVSLSRDGSRAFVGVPREDTIAVDAGAARTFTRSGSTWTHEALLQHSDAVANDLCGLAIVSNAAGDRVAVGCPLDDTSLGANAGTVRVFTLASGSWSADSSISITDGQDGDQLGFSVALTADGRRLVAGAPGDDVDVVSAAGSARVFDLVGASWREGGLARPTTLAEEAFGRSVAIASDGVSILAGGDAADTLAGADAGGAWALVARGEPGESCGSGTHCASGFCADGVCCDTACGGGVADDCQACVASLTGGTDGRCAPLDDATAPRTVCRAVAGDCDVEERCVAGSTACPTDTVDPAGTACRVASGACDIEERCDGGGPGLPRRRARGRRDRVPRCGGCVRRGRGVRRRRAHVPGGSVPAREHVVRRRRRLQRARALHARRLRDRRDHGLRRRRPLHGRRLRRDERLLAHAHRGLLPLRLRLHRRGLVHRGHLRRDDRRMHALADRRLHAERRGPDRAARHGPGPPRWRPARRRDRSQPRRGDRRRHGRRRQRRRRRLRLPRPVRARPRSALALARRDRGAPDPRATHAAAWRTPPRSVTLRR